MPRKAKEKFIEPFWKELVSVWFAFIQSNFNTIPVFDGSAPRDLKSIIKALRERATTSNIDWTLKVATSRLNNFLSYAIQDDWLRRNFLLFNINRQKEKIFFNIKSALNKKQYHNE